LSAAKETPETRREATNSFFIKPPKMKSPR
jgi:hypothetical protein